MLMPLPSPGAVAYLFWELLGERLGKGGESDHIPPCPSMVAVLREESTRGAGGISGAGEGG